MALNESCRRFGRGLPSRFWCARTITAKKGLNSFEIEYSVSGAEYSVSGAEFWTRCACCRAVRDTVSDTHRISVEENVLDSDNLEDQDVNGIDSGTCPLAGCVICGAEL